MRQHKNDAGGSVNLVGAIARVGERAAAIARALVPDPWVIAILLAVVVLASGFLVGDLGAGDLLLTFAFGSLEGANLAFAFQMVLVLMTGSAIAKAPVVERAILRLADRPQTSSGAAALTAALAMATSLFNWGLGLVVGALFVRAVGRSFHRRQLPLHYPVVGAAGFIGIAVWHGGLSGSAPLKVATAGAFGDAIPISATLFSGLNLTVTALVCVAFCALFYALGGAPAPPLPESLAAPAASNGAPLPADEGGRVERLDRSAAVLALLALPLLAGVGVALARKGTGAVTLDLVILVFLVLGLALHRTPAAYARAFGSGAEEASGIVLQFPLYFGIVAVARDSGLVVKLADAFSALAALLPLAPSAAAAFVTYGSACAVNFLVPSGGGQWVVQSPVILGLARDLAVDRAPLVMAFAYGDQTTNLLQPFWALPLLSISGLKARDIMGYTMVALALELAIVVPCLLVWSQGSGLP